MRLSPWISRGLLAPMLTLPVAVLGLVPAGPALADDTTAPQLVDVSLSRAEVTVSGASLVPVIVRAHLIDESGVVPAGVDMQYRTPLVRLTRVAGGTAKSGSVELALESGTAQDGIWSAALQVPSTWDGEWAIVELITLDSEYNKLTVDPRDVGMVRTLAVHGSHQPAMTMRFRPDPVLGNGPVTVTGRFYDSETGAPFPYLPIFAGSDNRCVEYSAQPNARTDRYGRYAVTFPPGDAVWLKCVGISRQPDLSYPDFVIVTSGYPRIRYVVTATADRTHVLAGKPVTITGRVEPFEYAGDPTLQRWVGTAWQAIGTAPIDGEGHFSYTVRPETPGTHRYRAYMAAKGDLRLGGASAPIEIHVR